MPGPLGFSLRSSGVKESFSTTGRISQIRPSMRDLSQRYSLSNFKKLVHGFRCKMRVEVTWLGMLVTGIAVEQAESGRGNRQLLSGSDQRMDTKFMFIGKPMPVQTADAVVQSCLHGSLEQLSTATISTK